MMEQTFPSHLPFAAPGGKDGRNTDNQDWPGGTWRNLGADGSSREMLSCFVVMSLTFVRAGFHLHNRLSRDLKSTETLKDYTCDCSGCSGCAEKLGHHKFCDTSSKTSFKTGAERAELGFLSLLEQRPSHS